MSYWIVLLAILARFAPHPPNFSPLYGALLFGGAHLRRRDFLWYPLALLAATDVVLYAWVYRMPFGWSQAWVWLGFAAILLTGRAVGRRPTAAAVLTGAVAAPTAFYLLSNFGVWLGWRMYPPTGEGLLACYVAALPFYRNSLVSSVLGSAALFGAHALFLRKLEAAGPVAESEKVAPRAAREDRTVAGAQPAATGAGLAARDARPLARPEAARSREGQPHE